MVTNVFKLQHLIILLKHEYNTVLRHLYFPTSSYEFRDSNLSPNQGMPMMGSTGK